jgi:hypothetical protein
MYIAISVFRMTKNVYFNIRGYVYNNFVKKKYSILGH